ncbi:MAG: hypothetical protein FRX49_11043 [Trebouxia sp. A1-2]|nr:MAG: hypothetical protein FRX49_11043 [Trebouxia sp. A1-2]
MAGGGGTGSNNNPNKIKGGRWTVAKFFSISLAFTMVWMTIISQLGYYKILYGPQVLLQMNIAYFLPSIPLLGLSSQFDERLDQKFGVARTILVRLLIGLGGCALICAAIPFEPTNLRWLLASVIVLGLMHGIAFSAAYQMVARFANKNTISLGLGCVGSGLLALALELILSVGPKPTRVSFIILFEVAAGVVMIGFIAAISLLLRHWGAIERYHQPVPQEDLTMPLLQEEGRAQEGEGLSGASARRMPRRSVVRSLSTMHMMGFTPLGFFETVSEGENLVEGHMALPTGRPALRRGATFTFRPADALPPAASASDSSPRRSSLRRTISVPVTSTSRDTAPLAFHAKVSGASRTAVAAPSLGAIAEHEQIAAHPGSPPSRAYSPFPATSGPLGSPPQQQMQAGPSSMGSPFAQSPQSLARESSGTMEVVRGIWPVMISLFLSGVVGIMVFPFFTYVPSSGWLNDLLPKVLFFSTIIANLVGRTLPKWKMFAIKSPTFLMYLGFVKLAAAPLCFVYLKSSSRWQSDAGATVYVTVVWALGGYLNTCSYMVAPTCVVPNQKANAAGLMAITSQISHCVGLFLAVVIATVLFGGVIDV